MKWLYGYKEPPPTLQVLYQGRPVAELQKFPQGYVFRYLALFRELKLTPFPGLALDKGDLPFEDLPAFFQERLPDMKRPEIRELVRQYGIQQDDKLQLLARVGTHAVTDPFELRLGAAA
jgi:HipA-like protein